MKTMKTVILLFVIYNFGDVKSYIVNPGPKYVATQGYVWPKPQNQETNDNFYTLLPTSFQFLTTEDSVNCNLLQNAFRRYYEILQKNSLSPSVFKKQKVQKNSYENEVANLGILNNLTVNVAACDDESYPLFDSDESYQLNVTQSISLLTAPTIWGLLRGLETFSQLTYLVPDSYEIRINVTTIQDYPRFQHRGLLLDTSRHYIPIEKIKTVIDGLVYNKLNVFHWHLVDDQSFPFVSTTFPELSEQGAYNPAFTYSPENVQEIIEYARQRGVRVIPEIDTPGHTRSWGVSHPELLTNCTSVQEGALGPLDPSKNITYEFLDKLLTEVKNVFPDPYIHLGGDEVGFECWEADENINAFMNENNFTSYEALESFYINKVIDISNKLNYSPIVWEEVFTNNVTLPQTAIVHVWKSDLLVPWETTIYKVTAAKKTALLSACWYLDNLQSGGNWQGFYQCEPTDFGGTEDQIKLVIGGEACMWAEVVDVNNVISRIFPRVSSTAERLWSAPVDIGDDFDWTLTDQRLEEHTCRMNRRGVGAQPPNAAGYCL